MLFIILYCSLLILKAEDVAELEPTIIQEEVPSESYPRAVDWPMVTEKLPERAPLPQFDDTLNSTGEVQARFDGSPTISIRGSGQSGRVLSLFNNVPLNFSTGFGPPNIFLPKEIISQISVAKGPASIFYGSQAMGGSVHFVPERVARSELRFSASDTNDSYLPWRRGNLAQHNVTLIAPVRKTPRAFSQVSLFTENDDGLFPYSVAGAPRAQRANNASQLNRLTLIGEERLGNLYVGYDLIAGNENRTSPGPIQFPQVTGQNVRGTLVSLVPSYQLSSTNLLRTRLSYLSTQADFTDSGSLSYFNQETVISQTEYQLDVSRFNLQFFGDYFSHDMDNTFFGDGLHEDSFEVAGVYKAYLTPIIYVQAGNRYLLRHSQLINMVGLGHTPYPFKVWLTGSDGFRAPTLSDKFANTPFSVANPNLQPEKSQQVELGFQYQPVPSLTTTYRHHLAADLRLFHVKYTNFFENEQVSPTQTRKINRGEGTAEGVDSSLTYQYGPWVTGLQYNILQTRDRQTGEAFRLSPEQQVTWHIDHYIGMINLRVQNVWWETVYDRDLAGNLQKLPSWNQWNIELHTFGLQKTNFSIGVMNLFDASKQLTLDYPEPQRRYWLQVRHKF